MQKLPLARAGFPLASDGGRRISIAKQDLVEPGNLAAFEAVDADVVLIAEATAIPRIDLLEAFRWA